LLPVVAADYVHTINMPKPVTTKPKNTSFSKKDRQPASSAPSVDGSARWKRGKLAMMADVGRSESHHISADFFSP
jgi:hypothetical protein